MFGEKIEERRQFTKEERTKILNDNYGICACCGKRLKLKTLTIEHIIPISRGGTNEDRNLTALCESCNKLKGNLLYMPSGFYSALRDKPRFREMEIYVREWFQTVKNEFDIERFPLISPEIVMQLNPVANTSRRTVYSFNPQLLFKWQIVGKENKDEIEAITDINVREIRKYMEESSYGDGMTKVGHPVPLYCLKKVSSDNILALIAVNYWKGHGLTVFIPWHCMSKMWAKNAVYNFVANLMTSVRIIGGDKIKEHLVLSPYEEAADIFSGRDVPEYIGIEGTFGQILDKETGVQMFFTKSICSE